MRFAFNKNSALLLVLGVLSLVFGGIYDGSSNENSSISEKSSLLETSVLTMLKTVNEGVKNNADNKIAPGESSEIKTENDLIEPVKYTAENIDVGFKNPDLSIEKVILKKISDPQDNFNYYKYSATVFLRNYGDDLENARVLLAASNAKTPLFVQTNEDLGFSLKKNEDHTVKNFEILFDGRYNGGKIDLNLEIKDPRYLDLEKENNSYEIEIFELPSKLDNFRIVEIEENGNFLMNFDESGYSYALNEVEFFFSKDLAFEQKRLSYHEIFSQGKTYSYGGLKFFSDALNASVWRSVKAENYAPFSIQIFDNPFEDEGRFYVFAKSTNLATGFYKLSDILVFSKPEYLRKKDFQKLIFEATNTVIGTDLPDYFEEYFENDILTREQVLKAVMDHLDVDLTAGDELLQKFSDVSMRDSVFPYLQSAIYLDKATDLAPQFNPQGEATKNYLSYLIYEFAKAD